MSRNARILVLLGLTCLIIGVCIAQELPVISSFTAEPSEICRGQKINLSWAVSNAQNITIEPEIMSVGPIGSIDTFPKNNTTYKLIAMNGEKNATTDLEVIITDCIAIEKFLAEPLTVCKGDNATLQWNVVGASNVSIDHGIGEVPSTGIMEITGIENTSYNLTAINGTKVNAANCTLTVDTSCPSIEYFDVDSQVIIKGSKTTLKWNVTNAENVSINNGIGEVNHSGFIDISPNSTIEYILNASNGTNFVISKKIVNVETKFPEIINFKATPSFIVRGTGSTITWNVTGADYVSIYPNIGKVIGNDSKKVILEENITYILTASNASGNVTEQTSVRIDNIAYDFVARAPYAKWHAEINGEEYPVRFGSPETSVHGYAKYDDDDAHSILKIGPRGEGRIIGDFTNDMVAIGYFIDSRDTLKFKAELAEWTNILSNFIIKPTLNSTPLNSYNLYSFAQTTEEEIPLLNNAGEMPRFYLVVDCNGKDYGDDAYIREMKIVRD